MSVELIVHNQRKAKNASNHIVASYYVYTKYTAPHPPIRDYSAIFLYDIHCVE